jgi:hypothetical protein
MTLDLLGDSDRIAEFERWLAGRDEATLAAQRAVPLPPDADEGEVEYV